MLRSWLAQSRRTGSDVSPEGPFSAIGDIHGCLRLLQSALAITQQRPTICVGDYVDRGDHSADVLRLLQARPDIICLSGNHEEMMLRFVEDPAGQGRRWLRFGGVQTLESFGVSKITENDAEPALLSARDQLIEAMGPSLLAWMKSLPTYWQSGNIAVVHAGADPTIPISDQPRANLIWGHPDFLTERRKDQVWVIHGHTIVNEPNIDQGRVAIDTGAYATGRLSIVHVNEGAFSFETLT